MDYAKLIKRLRRYVEIEREEHHAADLEAEAADAIEELEKKMLNWQATADDHWEAYQLWFHKYMDDMPKWVPVNERLPEDYDDAIVTDGVDYYVAYWRKDAGAWDSCQSGWVDADITHWMPLPTPPKEETRSGG